jgi:hypothetical protein
LGDYPAHYAGVTVGDMFYDPEKIVSTNLKFIRDFDVDFQSAGSNLPGKAFDILDYKTYRWPGNHLPKTAGFQYVEGEYMDPEDYDALIKSPEGYFLRTYIPRTFGAAGGLAAFPPLFASTELAFLPAMLAGFGIPPMQAALKAMLDAGSATLEFFGATSQVGAVAFNEMGLPSTAGGFTKAPFDFLGDTLRGTKAVIMDMFRRPAKVIAACEALTPLAIEMGIANATASGNPYIMIPLHKGADGFMSGKDFERFYWPSFKALLLGLIEEGCIPSLFVEGGYNSRLDVIANAGLPAGKSVWTFDQTDMAAAKEKFGSWACIGGNVPASLFQVGTPADMERAVKSLIDVCAPGGGYFISPGAVLDHAQAENVHTYLKVAKEYGKY